MHVSEVLDDDLGVELSPHHGYVRKLTVPSAWSDFLFRVVVSRSDLGC